MKLITEENGKRTVTEDDGFNKYRYHIIEELKRLSTCIESLDNKMNVEMTSLHSKIDETFLKQLTELKVDIATLKIKCSIYGGLAGAGGTCLAALVMLLVR